MGRVLHPREQKVEEGTGGEPGGRARGSLQMCCGSGSQEAGKLWGAWDWEAGVWAPAGLRGAQRRWPGLYVVFT